MANSEYKEIPLRGKRAAGRVALVDASDFEVLMQFTWFINDRGYAVRNQKPRRMHRVIMNAPADKEVDHKNRNRLDNRRRNLRFSDEKQTAWNQSKHRDSRNLYKGVGRDERNGLWAAAIFANGHEYYLGRWPTIEQAARAYDAAARFYHGEFAATNFEGDRIADAAILRAEAWSIRKQSRSSQYRGVTWFQRDQNWRASIRGRHIGYFDNEVDAARAVDDAARSEYGQSARLNFPDYSTNPNHNQ